MGDKRPVARSGKNEGMVDYSTAQSPQEGKGLIAPATGGERKCPYFDRIALLKETFTPDECTQIINTGLNGWKEESAP